MKGYWIIFGSAVADAEAQSEYARLWGPISETYQAKVKVLDADQVVETLTSSRVLAVEFPSLALAKACYADPAYTEAKGYALRAASREMIIIEGDLA
ncbi:DUF1330 domain-containing protein [Pseudomonas monteilii]|uniref:DUF1330 domain-containing protein n=1 Tax=Pseudomonas monteilii TaxID=76759 RepID=UPI00383A19AC